MSEEMLRDLMILLGAALLGVYLGKLPMWVQYAVTVVFILLLFLLVFGVAGG